MPDSEKSKKLEGKVCVVTGGAGSIGREAARLFINEGAKVMLVDRNMDALARAAQDLAGHPVDIAVADVADREQVQDFVRRTVEKWGKIDVLFSNAGNDGPLMPIAEYSEDVFDGIIRTHVRGGFMVLKHTLPHMRDGGSVIITSSITGVRGVRGNCAYVMAKHALSGLMRAAAMECAPRKIRVNSVNPGPLDNKFMRDAEATMSVVLGKDAGRYFDEIIPMGRHGEPKEVAQAVLFLASDDSSYISGTALMVDGAMCA